MHQVFVAQNLQRDLEPIGFGHDVVNVFDVCVTKGISVLLEKVLVPGK
jgi:hypothetical protein